jgi:hypothetical protein
MVGGRTLPGGCGVGHSEWVTAPWVQNTTWAAKQLPK